MSPEYDKTFIGVDYGLRRIGVAKSDPTGLIASALTTIEVTSYKRAVAEFVELLKEYQPDGLVIGYPLLPSGDRGDICDEIDRFVISVTKIHPLPVYKADERYTSQEAADVIHAHGKKVGRDKKRVDRLAAVLILQRFLDEKGYEN